MRPFSTLPPDPFTAAPEFSGAVAPVALPLPAWANAKELERANTAARAMFEIAWFVSSLADHPAK
jgi:hypothetical protein